MNFPGCSSGPRCQPRNCRRQAIQRRVGNRRPIRPDALCRQPRFPYTSPRAGSATSSPSGVTRFCNAIAAQTSPGWRRSSRSTTASSTGVAAPRPNAARYPASPSSTVERSSTCASTGCCGGQTPTPPRVRTASLAPISTAAVPGSPVCTAMPAASRSAQARSPRPPRSCAVASGSASSARALSTSPRSTWAVTTESWQFGTTRCMSKARTRSSARSSSTRASSYSPSITFQSPAFSSANAWNSPVSFPARRRPASTCLRAAS